MPVNFNILQSNQPMGGVVANLPAAGPSGLSSFASGLNQGIDAAGAWQNQQAQAQQMQQSAALAPLMQQKAQQEVDAGAMALDEKNKARMSADQLDAAFSDSWDKGMTELKKHDPAGYTKLQVDIADQKDKMASVAQKLTSTKLTASQAYHEIAASGADLVQHAAQAEQQQPGAGAAVYAQGLKMMGPELSAVMPQEFNAHTVMLQTKLGADEVIKKLKDEENKNATTLQKDLNKTAELTAKEKDGTLTADDKIVLDGLRQKQNSVTRGMNGTPAQQVNVATTKARLSATGKTANLATQTLSTINQMEKLNDAAFSGRGADTELKVKQFMTYLGVTPEKGVSTTEAFNSLVRQAQLSAQTLLKGSSSDRDMEIVAETSPQLFNTIKGRELMLSAGKYKAKADQQYDSFLNSYQNKHDGSLEGADESWNNFVQSRSDFDKKTLKFNSDGINKKAWEPFLDENYVAPKAEAPKAYTLNGGSFDMEAAKKATGLSEAEIVKQAGLK